MKAKPPLEHGEQVAFVQWFRAQYPKVRIYAVPNAAKRGYGLVKWLQDEGMGKGVPDLCVPEFKMVIEMKRTGSKKPELDLLTDDQRIWRVYYLSIGWIYLIGVGAEDAINKVKATLGLALRL